MEALEMGGMVAVALGLVEVVKYTISRIGNTKDGAPDVIGRDLVNERLGKIEDRKVSFEVCEIKHVEANKKFDLLFGKLDSQSDAIKGIGEDVKRLLRKD